MLKQGIPYCAIEVTNYKPDGYLAAKEILRYQDNLNYWSSKHSDIHKIIVVQNPKNLKVNPYWSNAYEEFINNRISVKIMR